MRSLPLTLTATLALAFISSSPLAGAEQKNMNKSKREGPLKDLPSAPGAHIAKIAALHDNEWLQLGAPKADPKWGIARGRSWGGRALIYAPDIEGAFFYGEGPHAGVKPDGHGMDDMWVYDVNEHRWIAVFPGIDTKNFNQRVKTKELSLNENGTLVDKDLGPIPVHALIHAWDNLSYDTDRHQFAFLGAANIYRYFLPGEAVVEEGFKLLEAQRAGKTNPAMSPWFYDTMTGKFDIHPITSAPPSTGNGYPYFQYVPSRKQYALAHDQGLCWYDPVKSAWTVEADKGPRPPGYDHGGCYDAKRDRIYMGSGVPDQTGGFYIYDIKSATWTKPASKGAAPWCFRTNDASAFYDSANDVVAIFQYSAKVMSIYDPNTDSWENSALPESVLKAVSYPSFNAFYDSKLNAYFVYTAADGGDNGIMWAYRYKVPKSTKKEKTEKKSNHEQEAKK